MIRFELLPTPRGRRTGGAFSFDAMVWGVAGFATMPILHPDESLAEQLERLNDELRCIRDVLDEVRTDLVWALQNGRVILFLADVNELTHVADATVDADMVELTVRLHTALAVLRNDVIAAVDAQREGHITAQDVDRSLPASAVTEPEPSASTPSVQPSLFVELDTLPPITLYEIGDSVRLEHDGREESGEITALDDARNLATVMLIPSTEEITLSQDLLTKLDPPDPG